MPLDLEAFTQLPDDTIFAEGTYNEPELYEAGDISYMARKGAVNDWALYWVKGTKPLGQVKAYGIKVLEPEVVRRLVKVSDEVMQHYRW